MTCSVLNLRLNRCEDNGVSHLFQDLCVNKYLKTLNISCNDLTVRCLPYMNSMISDNATLTELDLSANPLYQPEGEDGGAPGADATLPPAAAGVEAEPGADAGAGAAAVEGEEGGDAE